MLELALDREGLVGHLADAQDVDAPGVSPAAAKFIRITQTGTPADNAPWSMQRLRLFAAPARAAGSAVR